ncbi:MAG: ATP-binding protein [Ignavibacteria bacterium]|nr:ATP-binding protein [Ignavibacteria bacterium]
MKRKYANLNEFIKPNKVLVIFGPRQVGKTTLISDYLSNCSFKYKFETGDNIRVNQILSSQDLKLLKEYIAGYELLVIDEAQYIPNIGISLKLLVDNIPNLKIIATGSSSFELAGQIGEPLLGRKTTLQLFPISISELMAHYNKFELSERLPEFLIYGLYPEVLTTQTIIEKKKILDELVHSSLLKDIFALENIKSPKVLLELLRLLAFQIGSEVSLNELAQSLRVDVKTVQRYIDLLEKSFTIIGVSGFSKNLRNEMTKKRKYYFYDTGIRNGLISNFNSLELRNDVGQLWENFVFIERMKKRIYYNISANQYFWRTWNQKEIDLIEERDGKLFAYECKWKEQTFDAPKEWKSAYPEAEFKVIHPGNIFELII